MKRVTAVKLMSLLYGTISIINAYYNILFLCQRCIIMILYWKAFEINTRRKLYLHFPKKQR